MSDPTADPRPSTPEAPSGKPRPRHFSMLRSLALADLITIGNAASGTVAILLCLAYVEERHRPTMWAALALFPIALVCDVADGMVARWRHKSSPYGADLDSLADIVSFGVAPAVLGFALGLRGAWDAVILTYFVACGIGRLARFNVTAPALMTDKGKVSHFQGTPIPTSLALVAVWAIAFALGAVHEDVWWGVWQLGPFQLHPFALVYAVSGSAMISATLKIPKP
ncbi:MAG: CDP-alcohol phosphatidyltransferase family protein [Myxococcales bacterium]|nr:CDP-alcohol phosphatidyltransferase family protein [Myxococcales bacterium]